MKKLKKIIKPLLLLISFVLLSNTLFAQIYQTNKYKEGINGKSTTLYATFDFNKIGEDVLIITLNQKQYVFIVLKTTIINYDPITEVS